MAFWRAKEAQEAIDSDVIEPEEDTPELEILKIVEVVTKYTQDQVKDIKNIVEHLVSAQDIIKELKEEVKQLKAELRDEKTFNRHLIDKLIDKPSAPSAAATYLANKATTPVSGASSTSSTAGPKGKLP